MKDFNEWLMENAQYLVSTITGELDGIEDPKELSQHASLMLRELLPMVRSKEISNKDYNLVVTAIEQYAKSRGAEMPRSSDAVWKSSDLGRR